MQIQYSKPVFFFIILLCCLSANVKAQNADSLYYHQVANPTSSGNSGTGDNINVIYHKVFWRINPDSSVKYIKGYVQTNFITTEANVNEITFDFNSVLNVTAVQFRGANLPAGNIVKSGNVLFIQLGATLAQNFKDSVKIFYEGTPPAASGAAQGYQKATSASAGTFITTLSESYEDRDWWPCKADMQDKIDSMDIIVSVPWASPTAADTFWVATNGKLIDSTITGNSRIFTYQTRYPIASYLVFVAVARFTRFHRNPVDISGTPVPVMYYLFKGKSEATYTSIVAAMDRINPVMQALSERIGDYPFKLEKHGFYDGLLGAGGMEHQTFSGIATNSLQSTKTLVHELMHQWFGDNVSFSTWNDLWLAEGFARYSEALAGELVPSTGINPFTTRQSFKNSALSNTVSAWIPNANIANSNTIWGTSYGSAIYERGAMIVSMLRAISGDTRFYKALKNYQTNMGGRSATSDSLKAYFNAALGIDISPFFNDYVGGSGNGFSPTGGKGYPDYLINWASGSNRLSVEVATQIPSGNSNVSYYRGPIVLHITGANAAQDTTVCIFDWGNGNLSFAGNGVSAPIPGNLLVYNLSFTPLAVAYDDSARTLSTGATNSVSVIPVTVIDFKGHKAQQHYQLNLTLVSSDPINTVELLGSNDGVHFNAIGNMIANGINGTVLNYTYTDLINRNSDYYYRARIITPGKEELTKIVKFAGVKSLGMEIAPNPATSTTRISFNANTNAKKNIRIINSIGATVFQLTTADNYADVDVRKFATGIYQVQWIEGSAIKASASLEVVR